MGEDSAEMVQAKLNLEANRRAAKIFDLERLLREIKALEDKLQDARVRLEKCEATPLSEFMSLPPMNSPF